MQAQSRNRGRKRNIMKIRYTMVAVALAAMVSLSAFAQGQEADKANVIAIDIKSENGGKSLFGTMSYSEGDPIAIFSELHATNGAGNVAVENQLDKVWEPAGRWVIGGRRRQNVISLELTSSDNGKTLDGTMAYDGENEIRVHSTRTNGVAYDVDNQMGGPFQGDGAWVLGTRGDKKQYLVGVDIATRNNGRTLDGTITYDREGPLRFRATQLVDNSYQTEVYFGDDWHEDGIWLIGSREKRVTQVTIESRDRGQTLSGLLEYDGEDPVGFRGKVSKGTAYTVQSQSGTRAARWSPEGVFVLGNRNGEVIHSLPKQSGFPAGFFQLTTKAVENQNFVLESFPPMLQKSANNAGMNWKATASRDGFFRLTSQYLEAKNQVLEGGDGREPVSMREDRGVTGTEWKAVPAGNGYYYLTTRFMEESGKVLDGNVGETDAARRAPHDGAPYMVDRRDAGQNALWKILPIRGNSPQVQIQNSVGMQFKRIPAGSFLMGSPESENGRADDEQQHEVSITRDYYIGTTEVTQSQWEAVMGTTPWKGEEKTREGAEYAASYISWNDAVKFCEELSRMDGRTYRLPTEAEWEYACRAGNRARYSFGSADLAIFGDDEDMLEQYAWYYDSEPNYASKVGRKSPNGFGLYDMHGNVWEYCQDLYDDYLPGSVTDPTGPSSGSRRVKRGGSFATEALKCRSAYRSVKKDLDETHATSGLRVVMVPVAVRDSQPGTLRSQLSADDAKRLVIGSWKINLNETLKISHLDRDLQDDAVRVVIDIEPDGNYPRLEKLDGENHFELIHVLDGNKVIQDIQFLSNHRMILKASHGFPDMVLERVDESISLDQVRKLVMGKWSANLKETKKLNEDRRSPFPELDGNMSMEFRQHRGTQLSMTMRSNVGVSVIQDEFQAGVGKDHFQFGQLDIHFLNEDRFILYMPRHADVVVDRNN